MSRPRHRTVQIPSTQIDQKGGVEIFATSEFLAVWDGLPAIKMRSGDYLSPRILSPADSSQKNHQLSFRTLDSDQIRTSGHGVN